MTDRTCSIEGCGRKHKARGWCKMHHERWLVHGDPLKTVDPNRNHQSRGGPCVVPDCTATADASRGMCWLHYSRWWKYGDPTVNKREIVLEPCAVDGCTGQVSTKSQLGLCRFHYDRHRRYGDPTIARPVGRVGCRICTHPDWEEIDAELRLIQPYARGANSVSAMAARRDVPLSCLERHRSLHLDNLEHAEAMARHALALLEFYRATMPTA